MAEAWPSPSEPGQSQKLPWERAGQVFHQEGDAFQPGRRPEAALQLSRAQWAGVVTGCAGAAEPRGQQAPPWVGRDACVSPRCAFSRAVLRSTIKHVRLVKHRTLTQPGWRGLGGQLPTLASFLRVREPGEP